MGGTQSNTEETIVNNNSAGNISNQQSNSGLSVASIIAISVAITISLELALFLAKKGFQKLVKKEVARNATISV